ncbi:hypothetical protein [Reichenbachiella sp.]
MDQNNALLKLHFNIDPAILSDEDWLLNSKQLEWLMKNNQIPGIKYED